MRNESGKEGRRGDERGEKRKEGEERRQPPEGKNNKGGSDATSYLGLEGLLGLPVCLLCFKPGLLHPLLLQLRYGLLWEGGRDT